MCLNDTEEQATNSNLDKKYRFYRADFGPLTLIPLHYDLVLDMNPKRVRVISRQTYLYQGEVPTDVLELNSHDIDVKSVELLQEHSLLGPPPKGIEAKVPDFVAHVASLGSPNTIEYKLDNDQRKLWCTLPTKINKGDELVLRIVSECYPNDNVLEGIYYDYTPEGSPQTMITQCKYPYIYI